MLHHRDAVGALRRREPVRDRDHRAPAREHRRAHARPPPRSAGRVTTSPRRARSPPGRPARRARARRAGARPPRDARRASGRRSRAPSGSASTRRQRADRPQRLAHLVVGRVRTRRAARCRRSTPRTGGPPAGRRRCASAVRRASRRAGRCRRARPCPRCGSYARTSSFASVDLPAPVAPTRARCSPGAIVERDVDDRRRAVAVGERDAVRAQLAAGGQRARCRRGRSAARRAASTIFASAARPDWNSLYQSPSRATGSKSEMRYSANATTVPTVTRPCRSR